MNTSPLVDNVLEELYQWHSKEDVHQYFTKRNVSSTIDLLIERSTHIAWYNAVKKIKPSLEEYHQALNRLHLHTLAGQPYNCENIQGWSWDAKHILDYSRLAWDKSPEFMAVYPEAMMHVARVRNPNFYNDDTLLLRLTEQTLCPYTIDRRWIRELPEAHITTFYAYHTDPKRIHFWENKHKENTHNPAMRALRPSTFYHMLDLDILLRTRADNPQHTTIQKDIYSRLRQRESLLKARYGATPEKYNNADIPQIFQAVSLGTLDDLTDRAIQRWRLLMQYTEQPALYKRSFVEWSLEKYSEHVDWPSAVTRLFSQWLEWNDISPRSQEHPCIDTVYHHFVQNAKHTLSQGQHLTMQQKTPLLHIVGSSCNDDLRHQALHLLLQQGNHIPVNLLETMPKWSTAMRQLWCQWISCRAPGPLPRRWHRHLKHKALLSPPWPVAYRTQDEWMAWAKENNIENISPVGLNHSLGIPLDQALLLYSPSKTSLDPTKSLALEYIS